MCRAPARKFLPCGAGRYISRERHPKSLTHHRPECVRTMPYFLISLALSCWHSCASARVFWSKCSDPLLFSQGSAAPTLLFLWAGQGSSLAAFRQGSAAFLSFRGNRPLAVPGGWTSPPHCELRTILQTDLFRHRFLRANGFCTLEPHSFSPLPAEFPVILAAQLLSVFLCYVKNSLFCFRPFPEVTLLARRR